MVEGLMSQINRDEDVGFRAADGCNRKLAGGASFGWLIVRTSLERVFWYPLNTTTHTPTHA